MISNEKVMKAMDELDINEVTEESIIRGFLNSENQEDSLEAKIALTLYIDEERHKKGKNFNIAVRNYCKKCASKGYLPEREIIMSKTPCPDCDGTGVKTVPCKKCEGTGKSDGETCQTCKGSGKYRLYKNKSREKSFLCSRCQGTGEISSVQAGPNIVDFEVCPHCKGYGYNKNFPAQVIGPVKDLSGDISGKIEKSSQTKTSTTFGIKMKDKMPEELTK